MKKKKVFLEFSTRPCFYFKLMYQFQNSKFIIKNCLQKKYLTTKFQNVLVVGKMHMLNQVFIIFLIPN